MRVQKTLSHVTKVLERLQSLYANTHRKKASSFDEFKFSQEISPVSRNSASCSWNREWVVLSGSLHLSHALSRIPEMAQDRCESRNWLPHASFLSSRSINTMSIRCLHQHGTSLCVWKKLPWQPREKHPNVTRMTIGLGGNLHKSSYLSLVAKQGCCKHYEGTKQERECK